MVLFHERQQKLLEHRGWESRAAALGLAAPRVAAESRGSLAIHRAADGAPGALADSRPEPPVMHGPGPKLDEQCAIQAERASDAGAEHGPADAGDGPRDRGLGPRAPGATSSAKKR
eukprot:9503571-Pyramimonas_sp.AAC.1